jgi:hypothetical protein
MRTEPSGKEARISSVPPMASMNLARVLTGRAQFIESHIVQGGFDAGLDARERFRR